MDYDVIVFDTAPTGHTLRLLNFPTLLEKGLAKLMQLKGTVGNMMGQVSSLSSPLNGVLHNNRAANLRNGTCYTDLPGAYQEHNRLAAFPDDVQVVVVVSLSHRVVSCPHVCPAYAPWTAVNPTSLEADG